MAPVVLVPQRMVRDRIRPTGRSTCLPLFRLVDRRHQPCLTESWSCETNIYTRSTRQVVLDLLSITLEIAQPINRSCIGTNAYFRVPHAIELGLALVIFILFLGMEEMRRGRDFSVVMVVVVVSVVAVGVNVYYTGGFSDFNDLDTCCRGHRSEQHLPLNFLAVGPGLQDIRKKL